MGYLVDGDCLRVVIHEVDDAEFTGADPKGARIPHDGYNAWRAWVVGKGGDDVQN